MASIRQTIIVLFHCYHPLQRYLLSWRAGCILSVFESRRGLKTQLFHCSYLLRSSSHIKCAPFRADERIICRWPQDAKLSFSSFIVPTCSGAVRTLSALLSGEPATHYLLFLEPTSDYLQWQDAKLPTLPCLLFRQRIILPQKLCLLQTAENLSLLVYWVLIIFSNAPPNLPLTVDFGLVFSCLLRRSLSVGAPGCFFFIGLGQTWFPYRRFLFSATGMPSRSFFVLFASSSGRQQLSLKTVTLKEGAQ